MVKRNRTKAWSAAPHGLLPTTPRGVRARAFVVIASAAALSAALGLGAAPVKAQTAPTVTIGPLTAKVFQNPADSGAFVATTATPVQWSQTFPVVNFDPPDGTLTCSNSAALGVDDNTRPFTDLVPQADGSCTAVVVRGNGQMAGIDNTATGGPDLTSFQMEFSANLTVSAAGQVDFAFFSDDGWIAGIGPGPGGATASYVSGPQIAPPATMPFTGFPVVGSFNQVSGPDANDLVVSFPAAGIYPLELDYTECCGGTLSFTLQANGSAIAPSPSTTSTTSTTVATSTTSTTASSTTSTTASSTTSTTAASTTTTSTRATTTTTARATTTTTVRAMTTTSRGNLALTGGNTRSPLEAGGILLVVGGVAVVATLRRRRRLADERDRPPSPWTW